MNNKFVYSFQIGRQLLQKEVILYGWVQKKVNVGNFGFVFLRDSYGLSQLLIAKQNPALLAVFQSLTKETVIKATGTVQIKQVSKNNKNTVVDDFEVVVKNLEVINYAQLSPFMVVDKTDGQEKLRLQYRYLDLRRPLMQKNMWLRYQVSSIIRNYFYEKKDFIEMETPILASPTIEGARNFLVASNSKQGYYFALPQSPQIYKQLVMNSGFPNYFQITRCFRDEDMRQDRQAEFTQLDIEMNFAEQNNVMNLLEDLLVKLWNKIKPDNHNLQFLKLNYFDVWNKYGTDKPDLRYELFLEDHSYLLKFLSNETNNVLKGLSLGKELSEKQWKTLQQEIQKITKKALLFFFVSVTGVIKTNLNQQQQTELRDQTLKPFTWIGYHDQLKSVNLVLGKVRILLAQYFHLTQNKPDSFCWIINQPMFSYSHLEKKWVANHHPFCQPQNPNRFVQNWQTSLGKAYDLVINGVELGSGSERIYDRQLQIQVFQILGMKQKKIDQEFGFFLEAMKYGFPNHAGFALGLDRLLMILSGSNTIRDTIAFPKTTKMTCLLTNNPKLI